MITTKILASARYCWLVTAGEDGSPNSRPMGLLRHEPEAEIRKRWKPAYDPIARSGAHVAFIEIDVKGMDLWIQGITPEPFGYITTTLDRDAGEAWRVAPRGR